MKIDLRNVPDAEVSGIDLANVDITVPAPETEPQRQYYFMALLKQQLVPERAKQNGKEYLTACITTFGCQMNARDSEKLEGILETVGYHIVETEDADFVVYNTCTVRENANLRVYGRLGQLGKYKKEKSGHDYFPLRMHDAGAACCRKTQKSYHFVNLIFGTHNIYRFAEYLVRCMTEDRMVIDIWKDTDKIVENLPVDRKYPFKSGVNIMFGCNNFCSYCIVPYVRGRERSRKPEEIIAEIKRLVADGVVEIMLLGQNVNSYGKNLEEPMTFAQLLRKANQIEGLKRIRFMTSHPKDLSEELIDAMRDCEKVCLHLHLPLQSGSSRILKLMNRRYTKEQYLDLVDRIRAKVPDISLTTDIIVGFPGETEEDFLETLDVVRRVRYDSAFTFQYSRRTGTPAAAMEDQIPANVVKDRFDRLLAEVQEISREVTARHLHTVQEVLVESINEQDASLVTGRMSNNTLVHFPGDASMIGTLQNVSLDECRGFYYMGTLV